MTTVPYCAVLNTDQMTLAVKQRYFYPVCSLLCYLSIHQLSLPETEKKKQIEIPNLLSHIAVISPPSPRPDVGKAAHMQL